MERHDETCLSIAVIVKDKAEGRGIIGIYIARQVGNRGYPIVDAGCGNVDEVSSGIEKIDLELIEAGIGRGCKVIGRELRVRQVLQEIREAPLSFRRKGGRDLEQVGLAAHDKRAERIDLQHKVTSDFECIVPDYAARERRKRSGRTFAKIDAIV